MWQIYVLNILSRAFQQTNPFGKAFTLDRAFQQTNPFGKAFTATPLGKQSLRFNYAGWAYPVGHLVVKAFGYSFGGPVLVPRVLA